MNRTNKHARDVAEYVQRVQSGDRLAGRYEIAAVDRYLEDLEQACRVEHEFYFDGYRADAVCDFFETLIHTEGEWAGHPFSLYPWQKFVVYNLFGFRDRVTDLRRYREAFLSMARGNGKTPFGAGLMLYLLACDDPPEAAAQVFTAATKRDQANLSFDAAKRFVWRSPGLSRLVQTFKYGLFVPQMQSRLAPLAGEARTADGLNIHGLLLDELHAWTEYQREFREKLKTGMKRAQSLAITITTAGSDESDLWKQEYDFATAVVDRQRNVQADTLFVYICEIDEGDDPLDSDCWPKANPMLEYGVVKMAHIQQLADRAQVDPAYKRELQRYHGNRLVTSANRSITEEMWAIGSGPLPELKGKPCYAGVDLGWVDDLAAIGYVWPLDDDTAPQLCRRYAVGCDVFVPAGGRRDLNIEPWSTWIREGWLTVTDSDATDTRAMYAALEKRNERHPIKGLAFDKNNAREFALNTENDLGLPTYAFNQTCAKYNEPFREFLKALSEGRLLHGDNPLLEWCAMHVVDVTNPYDERMPSKRRSSDKIDPVVAIVMALSEALFAEKKPPSIYETRGPIVI